MKRFLILALFYGGTTLAQQTTANGASPSCGLKDVVFNIKLLSPLGTETAKPGDAFTMMVQTPSQFSGATIEGTVKTLVKAERGFGKGKPKIELEFTTLTYNNRTCHIAGDLKEVTNSKGVAKVDDEGRVVGRTSNKKRMGALLGGAALGALVGAAEGGGQGAIIGAAAGGTAGFILSSTMTAAGSDIQFQPGSVFTLQVSDARNGIH
jgi:hypothetical protein